MIEIRGIIPPIITPMHSDESINIVELRNQVNRLIDSGVHGIFALGTNGEAYILSPREKETVLSVVVEEVRGRVPVYAGTGCIGTGDTISLSRMAQKIGVDVLSVITPSFARASQTELYTHYRKIASEVDLPVVLYNIPARTGNQLSPETVRKLSLVENIAGVKDSSGNFSTMLQYLEVTKESDFAVLSGNDSLILRNLLAGGKGGIAGCANVFPKNMVAIYNSFISEDLETSIRCQENIQSFRDCFKYGNPNTIVKTAVHLLGFPVGSCRRPFNFVDQEGMDAIKRVLEKNAEENIE